MLSTNPTILSMSSANLKHASIPWGTNVSLDTSRPCYHGFVVYPILLILLDNLIALQGVKVLEDREVRSSYCYVTEGVPKGQASQTVLKYTGPHGAPEWMDLEQGSGLHLVNLERHSSQAENFAELCTIQADLAAASYVRKRGKSGKMCYTRNFDVVLLVGLTELQAQIAWIDSATVSPEGNPSHSLLILILPMSGSRGRRKGSKWCFLRFVPPSLKFVFRTDAVVVWDDPDEDIDDSDDFPEW